MCPVLLLLLTLNLIRTEEVSSQQPSTGTMSNLDLTSLSQIKSDSPHQFEAHVSKIMTLIVNSLYRNKEIFLRELVSNGSDALDKIRFLSLQNSEVLNSTSDLSIYINADPEAGTLEITDKGIGMTKEDLIQHLGTIADSGTSSFFEKLQDAEADNDLIGKFGVGFYSSFLVAEKVMVITKHNDDVQYIWTSDSTNYNIIEDPRGDTLKRGTKIVLFLRDDAREFLDYTRLETMVRKFSQFLSFPIYLYDNTVVEEGADKWNQINTMKPLWQRNPSEVEQSEYDQFYNHMSKDPSPLLFQTHFKAEGDVSFSAMVFVPSKLVHDNLSKNNVRLYVRRVFISDAFYENEFMPNYLRFLLIVIDSDDLPLNVSRDQLQESNLLKIIKKKIIRKFIEAVSKLSPEKKQEFWKEYGIQIKMGINEDQANRNRLAKITHFYSSHSNENLTTLDEYVDRMDPKQPAIYLIGGDSLQTVEKSPFVERLTKRGYEIIYLLDPVDEYAIGHLTEHKGKRFQNIAKGEIDLGDSQHVAERRKQLEQEYSDFATKVQSLLSVLISEVKLSHRLVNTSCVIVASSEGLTGNMERIMIAQTAHRANDPTAKYYMQMKRVLEVNPYHPLVRKLKTGFDEHSGEDEEWVDNVKFFYQICMLRSQYTPRDSIGFANRAEKHLKVSLNVEDVDIESLMMLDDYDSTEESQEEDFAEDIVQEADVSADPVTETSDEL